jgi:hypothetical protein
MMFPVREHSIMSFSMTVLSLSLTPQARERLVNERLMHCARL